MVSRDLAFKISVDGNASMLEKMNGATDKIKNSAISAGDKMQKLGKRFSDVGSTLTKRVSMPLLAVATASIAVVTGFDDNMSRVKAISGATGEEFDSLRKKAIELGSTTAHTASDAAKGMEMFAASGKNTNEILALTPQMLTLMSAGAVDSTTATKVLTGTMAQFNLKAKDGERIIDVFSQSAMSANTNVDQLQEAFKMAGGSLASMNMDIAQSGAMIAVLAEANFVGSEAGTMLDAVAREVKANAKGFKELGIQVYDETGTLKDMGRVMKDVERVTGKMTDEQRDLTLQSVFSGRAMKGVNAIVSVGSEKYDQLAASIDNSQGSAKKLADESEDNIGGSFRALKGAAEGAMIAIGDVLKEPIRDIAKAITEITRSFGDLDEDIQLNIVKWGAFAIAIGPVVKIAGLVAGGLGKITSAAGWLVGGVGILSAAFGTGGLLLAFGAVIAGGLLVGEQWDDLKLWAEETARDVPESFRFIGEEIDRVYSRIVDDVSNHMLTAKTSMEKFAGNASSAWNRFKQSGVDASSSLSRVVESIKTKWEELRVTMSKPISAVVSFIQKGAATIASKPAGLASPIGMNAKGTSNWRGGLTSIHERGGEIVDLPGGTRIYPHDRSVSMAREEGLKSAVSSTHSNTRQGDFKPTLNITVNESKDGRETVAELKRTWEMLMSQHEKRSNLKAGAAYG